MRLSFRENNVSGTFLLGKFGRERDGKKVKEEKDKRKRRKTIQFPFDCLFSNKTNKKSKKEK